jgi:two-component system LytT family response regulator
MHREHASAVTTSPIRALVVDDEALARRGVRQLLAAHPDVVVVGECRDGPTALAALAELRPDLLFLDIQMPELDGFTVLRRHAATAGDSVRPLTVFLTAFEDFALDAFDVEAVDYLVKPVSEQRFGEAMRRVRQRLAQSSSGIGSPPAGVEAAERAPPVRQLIIGTPQGLRVVGYDEIDWIGADDYYVSVRSSGRRYLLRESMASLEERLDRTQFVRIHRGAIVNIGRVREVRTVDGDPVVVLRDGTRLSVSRRRRAELLAALGAGRDHASG